MNRNPGACDEDDPTGEHELEFDPTQTDQLDDTYRMRVVSASENFTGTVARDERGQARWKWITEEAESRPGDGDKTFDHLKALQNDALAIESPDGAETEQKPEPQVGYNPYDAGAPITKVRKPK